MTSLNRWLLAAACLIGTLSLTLADPSSLRGAEDQPIKENESPLYMISPLSAVRDLLAGRWTIETYDTVNGTELEETSTTTGTGCAGVADCSFRGQCNTETGQCVCNDGYVTHDPSTPGIQCNYEQKQQWVAVLLEYIFGWAGAGYWYVGQVGLAVTKLLLGVTGIVLLCVFCCAGLACSSTDSSDDNCCAGCLMFTGGCLAGLLYTTIIVWYVVGIIMFMLNDIDDGNGVELESW